MRMNASGCEPKGIKGWGSASSSVLSQEYGAEGRKGELGANTDLIAKEWRVARVCLVYHFQVESSEGVKTTSEKCVDGTLKGLSGL
jgi:hypothetical protein